jgi:hypothetical protein
MAGLETDAVPVRERAEAIRAVMRCPRVAADLSQDPDADHVRARVGTWELGRGVSVVPAPGPGLPGPNLKSSAPAGMTLPLVGIPRASEKR